MSMCVYVGNETSEEDLHRVLLFHLVVRMKNFFNWNQLQKICVEFEKEKKDEEKTVNLSARVEENEEEKNEGKANH